MGYLNRLFLCTLAFVVMICATNWFIDPFGMYWSPVINGLNHTKPASGDRVRVTKAYRAVAVSPQILIVGNSRAEMALFPGHLSFGDARVYNQAMPGAGIQLQTDYARNTLHTAPDLQRVIMSVDYLDFLIRRDRFSNPREEATPNYLFRLSMYTAGWHGILARLREQATLLFSLDGLLASGLTIVQQGAAVNSIGPWGFNNPGNYRDILRHEGITALFVQKLQELNENMRDRDLVTTDPKTGQDSPRYTILADFLADLARNDIPIQLYISPYHISYLHLLNDLGMTEDFLVWKSRLLELVEDSEGEVELWDFSGPSTFIQETVPVGSHHAMQWYWEPAHYRRELGDKILETLATGEPASGFGVRLTKDVIDHVINEDRLLINNSRSEWLSLQHSLGIQIEPVSASQGDVHDSESTRLNTGIK